jgi:outer membrane protein TolC
MIGISIPLAPWSSGAATSRVEESEVNVQKAESEREAMKNMVLYEVQRALVGVQTNRSLLLLSTGTLIPQAEQTLRSTVASYQAGKTEFLTVIDAYRMLLEVKLDYSMALMNEMTSQAQLEQAVGLDIDDIAARVH